MQALPIAGLALGALGTFGATSANVSSLKAQSQAAEAEAASIGETTAMLERESRRTSLLASGKGRAIAASSGLDPSSGSPLMNDLENARQSELEALQIRRTGTLAQQGKQFQSQLAKKSIPGAIAAGVGQFGSILTNWMNKGGYKGSGFGAG